MIAREMAPVVFGRCVIDLDARQVVRDGQPVHVSQKAFELLRILIAERPRAVSKPELHERIWPGTFVGDDSLAGLAAEARAAIGDPARRAEFLRTVHGFGYAFAPVTAAAPSAGAPAARPVCWLITESRAIPLTEGENILGRDTAAQVVLDSRRVSRQHARITVAGSAARLEDLGSRNGTLVGGVRVTGPVLLTDGAELTVGGIVLTFRASEDAPPTEADD
jgi:DNA-binding winged helix-turn-helix (wHTH) protein